MLNEFPEYKAMTRAQYATELDARPADTDLWRQAILELPGKDVAALLVTAEERHRHVSPATQACMSAYKSAGSMLTPDRLTETMTALIAAGKHRLAEDVAYEATGQRWVAELEHAAPTPAVSSTRKGAIDLPAPVAPAVTRERIAGLFVGLDGFTHPKGNEDRRKGVLALTQSDSLLARNAARLPEHELKVLDDALDGRGISLSYLTAVPSTDENWDLVKALIAEKDRDRRRVLEERLIVLMA